MISFLLTDAAVDCVGCSDCVVGNMGPGAIILRDYQDAAAAAVAVCVAA